MALKFIPKIVYNGTTLTLTLPQKLWVSKSKPHGGSNWSDAGVPEAFIIRRDQMVDAEIRFLETEWASVDAWLAWGQAGNSFDFYFDNTDASTKITCYLLSPSMGDGDVSPVRDQYRHAFSIKVTLRTTNNSLIDVRT